MSDIGSNLYRLPRFDLHHGSVDKCEMFGHSGLAGESNPGYDANGEPLRQRTATWDNPIFVLMRVRVTGTVGRSIASEGCVERH